MYSQAVNQPWAVLFFTLLLVYNNYRVAVVSCDKRKEKISTGEQSLRQAHVWVQMLRFLGAADAGSPDDWVSWEEVSCRADGEGADVRVAARLELRSVSRDHVWVLGLLEAPTGLGRLLELWLETPLGLGGLLGASEVPPAADPVGEANCRSLWLLVRKLVLRREERESKDGELSAAPGRHSMFQFLFMCCTV